MENREAKSALFDQLAVVGKAFGSAKRLELIDLLSQGERTVESLAREAGLGVSTASAHLQVLKLSNLVTTRREGTRIHYRLAGEDVATMLLDHAGGVTSVVDCSYATKLPVEPFPETLLEVDGSPVLFAQFPPELRESEAEIRLLRLQREVA